MFLTHIYGEVISASLHNNFGFVQYKEEDGADQAVLALHQTQLFGKKVGECNYQFDLSCMLL